MKSPYNVVKDFEESIAEYAGSKYAVAVSSCTEALLLACAYWFEYRDFDKWRDETTRNIISLPKRTYVGVPMSVINAGGKVHWRDEEWVGAYQLKPAPIWDSAKWLTTGIYKHLSGDDDKTMVCISLHWAKTLAVGWGGVILTNDEEAVKWLKRARFDGRTEGVHPSEDTFDQRGWHCIMSPAQAAEALTRLSFLPKHNDPIPADGYPDLSKHKAFQ